MDRDLIRRWHLRTPALTAILILLLIFTGAGGRMPCGFADDGPGYDSDEGGGSSPHNIVKLVNRESGRLAFKAHLQFNVIDGPEVTPVNQAYALSSGTGTDSLAVALQLNLTSLHPRVVSPQNAAIALNYQCNSCFTCARAIQYTIPMQDPHHPPEQVLQLLRTMDSELHAISEDEDIGLDEALSRINVVISQFQSLIPYLDMKAMDATR